MFVRSTYWMWTRARLTASVTIGLDRSRRYLVTGALTGESGGDYSQVFISAVARCQQRSDPLRNSRQPSDPPDANIANLGMIKFLTNYVV